MMDFRIFAEPQQGASYDDQLALALATERLGFDAFFRSDHYLAMSGDGLPGPTDAWTTLAGIAVQTTTVRLGTLVSPVTFRPPGILAIQVAQVDQMSRGRVELGLGAGWFRAEHEAYGIDYPAKRFGLLEEQLQILKGLWSTPPGEKFSFDGARYHLVDSPALPKPVQSPPPIIVGGGGQSKTPGLAARYAAEYNSGFSSLAENRERVDRVRRACERVGRDPQTLVLSAAGTTATAVSQERAGARARAAGSSLERLRDIGFAGTADEVVERIGRLGELGFSRFYFQVMDMHDLDQVDFLAREVLTQL